MSEHKKLVDVVPEADDIREVLMICVINASRFADGGKAAMVAKLVAFERLNDSCKIDLKNEDNENIKDEVGNNFTLY